MCPDCKDKGVIALFTSVVPCTTCKPVATARMRVTAVDIAKLCGQGFNTQIPQAGVTLPKAGASTKMPDTTSCQWFTILRPCVGQKMVWIVVRGSSGITFKLRVPENTANCEYQHEPTNPLPAPDYWYYEDVVRNWHRLHPI